MGIILYRFFETEEFREAFISGILYSNKLSYFRSCENNTNGVKDDSENASLISIADDTHFVQHKIVERDGRVFVHSQTFDKKPDNYIENQGFIAYNQTDFNVFCMSAIHVDQNGVVTKFDKRNYDDFGEYGIIIIDTPAFLTRVNQCLANNPTVKSVHSGLVQYIDFDSRDSVQRWSPFMKFSRFSHQQEYRFAFERQEEGPLKYDVGSLTDITLSIVDKNDFYEAVNVGKPLIARGKSNEI